MSNQPRPHGPWTLNSTAEVYRDRFIHVWLDQVLRPDGDPGQHVVVNIKPGVCVLAIDDDNYVYLTSEFHYAVGRISLEAVSGGIEPGEDPLATAQRELAEELGLNARHWELLATIDPFTTIMSSPTRLYVARVLANCPTDREGTELIEAVRMPLADALTKIRGGEITHAPTCVGLLLVSESMKTR